MFKELLKKYIPNLGRHTFTDKLKREDENILVIKSSILSLEDSLEKSDSDEDLYLLRDKIEKLKIAESDRSETLDQYKQFTDG